MTRFYPYYIQVVKRREDGWYQPQSTIFYSPRKHNLDPMSAEKLYGLTKSKIVTELFRRYHGKLENYLVNLRTREYYYCGTIRSIC